MYVHRPATPLRARNVRRRGLGANYTTVANAVQTQEGWYPGSITYDLNDPGALTYAGQPGATPVTRAGMTWAAFPDYATGYQALLNQINLNASRGLTIAEFTAKYAPAASGNNPTVYARNIAAAAGLSPSDLLAAAADPESSSAPAAPELADIGAGFESSSFPYVAAGLAALLLGAVILS